MSKTFFALLSLFLFLLVVFFVVKSSYQAAPVLKKLPLIKTATTSSPESSLSLSPSTFATPIGKDASVQVTIDTKGTTPSLVQFELAYDPLVINAVSITPGMFFENPTVLLNTVDQNTGRISYAIEADSTQSTATGQGTVAIIHFRTNPYTVQKVTELYFLPKTMIKTPGSSNSLKAGYGTKITLVSGYAPQIASPAGIFNKEK